jgi:PAS domain-containing protein
LIVSTHANSSDYSDYYITALTVYILIFIISSINNSRRKENEERDAKYKLLAENSSDIVSIQDYKGTILYVSPSIKEQAGYEQTDLIGKNVLKIINKISYSEIERYNNDLQNKTIEKNAYLFYV